MNKEPKKKNKRILKGTVVSDNPVNKYITEQGKENLIQEQAKQLVVKSWQLGLSKADLESILDKIWDQTIKEKENE